MMAEKVDEKHSDRSPSLHEKTSHRDVDPDHDSIVAGTDGVTHHELATLRQVPDRIPIASFLVVFCEFAERCVPSSVFVSLYPKHVTDGVTTVQLICTTTTFVHHSPVIRRPVLFKRLIATLALLGPSVAGSRHPTHSAQYVFSWQSSDPTNSTGVSSSIPSSFM